MYHIHKKRTQSKIFITGKKKAYFRRMNVKNRKSIHTVANNCEEIPVKR